MKSRDQWAREQAELMAVYDEVKQELLRIPGVVDVGVGIKETGGGLTEQVSFRVFVEEKLPESQLPAEQVIPKTIRGFPTDVIVQREERPLIGFNDENDEKNYSVKVGGIYVGNDKLTGMGTLGCFCRRTSDGATVFLSNHHVLFDGGATVGAKVGQPQYSESCCCVCNKIGVVVDGDGTTNLDCAIATLDGDVPFIPKIRRIMRADGTVELDGLIAGSEAPVSGDVVWKVGARTGLTRGTLSQVAPRVEIHPQAPFTKIADHGDSGSVVVNVATDNVVALLRSIDATGNLGFATPIPAVLTRLQITIIATDPTQTYNVAKYNEDDATDLARLAPDTGLRELVARLRTSTAGADLLALFEAHQRECLDLVNHCRPVTVAWHRSGGPTFLAALARSARVPEYRVPDQVNGVSLAEAAVAMREALLRHGSQRLRDDIDVHGDRLLAAITGQDTAEGLARAWEAQSSPEPVGPAI
jgi:hypothetical protein